MDATTRPAAGMEDPGRSGRSGRCGLWESWREWLARPVNGASLAAFRVAVGLVMCLEAWSSFRPSWSTGGRIPLETYYTGRGVTFHLPYAGFEWLPTIPGAWLELVVVLMGVAGLCVAAGFLYRIAAATVFLCWGYLYALESTRTYWMSYYYLELLVTFLLIWMPAARQYSVDAWRRRSTHPAESIPFWPLVVLRAQLVITYFYAGVAKLTADWMFDAMPVRWFLAQPVVKERLDRILPTAWAEAVVTSPVTAYFLSWTGAVFDLAVGFLLLIRRTRILGLALLLIFHSLNHSILFRDIEWFPLVGATTGLIFLEPDWPQRVWAWLRRPRFRRPDRGWLLGGAVAVPGLGALLGWCLPATATGGPSPERHRIPRWVAPGVVAWIAFQTLVPLRHVLIPGDARFTFEGLSFSWRLKAELYQTLPARLSIDDPALLATAADGSSRIDWRQWRGEPVIRRLVDPETIDWATQPEIVVLSEPITGERILFNPLAGGRERTEEESRVRVAALWREIHGRAPRAVHRLVTLDEVLTGYAAALRAKGAPVPERDQLLGVMDRVHGSLGDGSMLPILRRAQPFAVVDGPATAAPFLWIDDARLFPGPPRRPARFDRREWRGGPAMRGLQDARREDIGGEPAVVLTTDRFPEADPGQPPVFLVDDAAQPGRPPRIGWNLLRDAGRSKAMHISINPFLLQRYCERVAGLWAADHGRRPAIRALTGLSLNGRPPQPVVDPSADLVTAPRSGWGHHPWVRDLKPGRIPAEIVAHPESLGRQLNPDQVEEFITREDTVAGVPPPAPPGT